MEIRIVIDDRIVDFFKTVFSKRGLVLIALFATLGSGVGWAALKADFETGGKIFADDMNTNFEEIETRLLDLENPQSTYCYYKLGANQSLGPGAWTGVSWNESVIDEAPANQIVGSTWTPPVAGTYMVRIQLGSTDWFDNQPYIRVVPDDGNNAYPAPPAFGNLYTSSNSNYIYKQGVATGTFLIHADGTESFHVEVLGNSGAAGPVVLLDNDGGTGLVSFFSAARVGP